MKRNVLLVIAICCLALSSQAQVGYGTNNPDPRAVVDLNSSDKALYLPRLTTAEITAQNDWKAGMVVFNTDSNCVVYFRGATDWDCSSKIDTLSLQGDTLLKFSLKGDSLAKTLDLRPLVKEPWFGTDDSTAATTNTEDIFVMSSKVGIGTSVPRTQLDVEGNFRVGNLSKMTEDPQSIGTDSSTLYTGKILSVDTTSGIVGSVLLSDIVKIDVFDYNASGDSLIISLKSDSVRRALSLASMGSGSWKDVNTNSGTVDNTANIYQVGPISIGSTELAEALIDIRSTSAQADLTSAGQFSIGAESASLILQKKHSPTNIGGGFAGPLIDFRMDNGPEKWSVAQIIGLGDAGNGGYAGGMGFLMNPGGTSNPPGSRTKGNALKIAMLIQADGDVGIGTTSPSQMFDVAGNAEIGPSGEEFFIGNIGYSNVAGMIHRSLGSKNANYAISQTSSGRTSLNSASGQDMYIGIGNSAQMMLDASNGGNVGIGDFSPVYDLTLGYNSAGKPGGGSWFATSDRRLKTVLGRYTKGLDIIKQINPVTYQYNARSGIKDTSIFVGIIAQEIEKVLPSTITYIDDSNGDSKLSDRMGFDSSELTWVLINAVKELHTENQLLRKELDIIKNRLDVLKNVR